MLMHELKLDVSFYYRNQAHQNHRSDSLCQESLFDTFIAPTKQRPAKPFQTYLFILGTMEIELEILYVLLWIITLAREKKLS